MCVFVAHKLASTAAEIQSVFIQSHIDLESNVRKVYGTNFPIQVVRLRVQWVEGVECGYPAHLHLNQAKTRRGGGKGGGYIALVN